MTLRATCVPSSSPGAATGDLGEVDLPHPAATQVPEDLVRTDSAADQTAPFVVPNDAFRRLEADAADSFPAR